MRHLDLLLLRHPQLRHVDFQRLVQRCKEDPAAHWDELVEASAPVVHTTALRLAERVGNAKALAEEVTLQVFERIAADDFAVVRDYVGYGKWPSLLVRLVTEAPSLRDVVPVAARATDDPDGAVPELDPQYASLLEKEGERFFQSMKKVLGVLHRRDRMLLAFRYEQDLTLRELDLLFRLGTPERVANLLDRLLGHLQPIRAVGDAWQMPHAQRHALLRIVVRRLFAEHSMATDDDRAPAPALQHR